MLTCVISKIHDNMGPHIVVQIIIRVPLQPVLGTVLSANYHTGRKASTGTSNLEAYVEESHSPSSRHNTKHKVDSVQYVIYSI